MLGVVVFAASCADGHGGTVSIASVVTCPTPLLALLFALAAVSWVKSALIYWCILSEGGCDTSCLLDAEWPRFPQLSPVQR